MDRLLLAIAATALLAGCGQPAEDQGNTAAATARNAAMLVVPLNRNAALKLMHDRHENMEKIRDANRIIGRQLKAGRPDLAAIRSSAATVAGLAHQVPSWFPAGTGPDVGKTMARPEVWQRPEDFAAKARAFQSAANALNGAARSGNIGAVQASFASLGKTCKACHDSYRNEHHR